MSLLTQFSIEEREKHPDRIWGNPVPEPRQKGITVTTHRAVLLFRNLPWSITAGDLRNLISFYSTASNLVLGIICEVRRDDSLRPFQGQAIALITDVREAARIAYRLDGAAFTGMGIRVHARRLSQLGDTVSDRPPHAARIYRGPSGDDLPSTLNSIEIPTEIPDPAITFHGFPRLPPEIRIMVWQLYITSFLRRRRYRQVEWLGFRKGFFSRTPVPACLQINRESRYEAAKHYQLSFATKRLEPHIRSCSPESYSFDDEFLYFTMSYTRTWPHQDISRLTLCRLFDKVEQTGLNRITKICFDIGLWFQGNANETPKASHLRLQLPSLRWVKVVLTNGLRLDENGTAQIDDLPIDFKAAFFCERDLHPERVIHYNQYRIFRRQTRDEALLHPNWKVPAFNAYHVTRGGRHLEMEEDLSTP